MRAVAGRMAILGDRNPLFNNGRFIPKRIESLVSDNHGQTGQNVLYLDMHVEWAETPSAGVDGNNIFLAEGIYEYTGNEEPTGPTDTFLLPTYCTPGDAP